MTHQLDRQRLLCPTPDCLGNGALGDSVVHSRRERRFKGRGCGRTFAATTGTPLYRLHHAHQLLIVVLALLAQGCPVQAIVFAYELHEDTVRAWAGARRSPGPACSPAPGPAWRPGRGPHPGR